MRLDETPDTGGVKATAEQTTGGAVGVAGAALVPPATGMMDGAGGILNGDELLIGVCTLPLLKLLTLLLQYK